MASDWLVWTLVTLVVWGTWGFLGKVALNYLDWKQVIVIGAISNAAIYMLVYILFKPTINFGNVGSVYALVAGAMGLVGAVFFYMALGSGRASIVVPLTALYPAITIVLSAIILKEHITLLNGFGIILSIVAIVLMSL